MIIQELINFLEEIAPPALQESYDNAGLIVGDAKQEFTKAIVCLDAIEEVIDEAIQKGANLVIAHHPIVFSGIKKLNGKNYVERTVIKAIKNDIAIYAIHTNLDNVNDGVNKKIADKLGLEDVEILSPKMNCLSKVVCFVPLNAKKKVLQAMFEAGAGRIGNYSEASFSHEGEGTFKGNSSSKPAIGELNKLEKVKEARVEVLVENYRLSKVLSAMQDEHPYEEVAYDVIELKNVHNEIGAGMIGVLPKELEVSQFFKMLQEEFQVPVVRHTTFVKDKIRRVALCGGSGSFLLSLAKRKNADVFLTGDFRYHEFFDADNQLIIADVGHYESEQFTSELLIENLNKKFRNFAFLLTEINTNPVNYFI
ncbi:MAG: dinuclear metal center YbgI/SA1388 family protein [Chitinophagales bacterium]|jgi:dinuclear metal center YbgI/SA1388 family protein